MMMKTTKRRMTNKLTRYNIKCILTHLPSKQAMPVETFVLSRPTPHRISHYNDLNQLPNSRTRRRLVLKNPLVKKFKCSECLRLHFLSISRTELSVQF